MCTGTVQQLEQRSNVSGNLLCVLRLLKGGGPKNIIHIIHVYCLCAARDMEFLCVNHNKVNKAATEDVSYLQLF